MIKRYFLPPLLALLPALAAAQTPTLACRPAIVYHTSQDALKDERSINQLAFAGIERVKKELKVAAREYFAPPGTDLAAALKQAAGEGATVVVTVGFHAASVLPQVAEGAPEVRFVLIDGMAPPLQNNLTSIMYKDHEGAFLAGIAAAMQSESHTIGFIGGMDVPIIRNFAYGFLQGAHYADENVKVLQTMLGTTDKAWTDSAKATAVAERHIANGADVLYPAAGTASTAVLGAAQAQKKWAVAADLNQNAAFPGTVLTSVTKRVDVSVFDSIRRACTGTLEAGIVQLGIAEGAIDYVPEGAQLTPDIRAALDKAKSLIAKDALNVASYAPD